MKPAIKKKLKNAPFVINWDAGERYYQIHVFEDADGSNWIQISSKINKDGKIEMYSRASKNGNRFNAEVTKPGSVEEFQETIENLGTGLEKAGFVHEFVDLQNCDTPEEAMNLLQKSDNRFKSKLMEFGRN